jgi:zinc transport system substrate-binding protein
MRNIFLTLLCCLAFQTICPGPAPAEEGKLQVVVSILPQQWFARQIGGDQVEVTVLVGPGHSPATFEPTPKQMSLLQSADLFVASGVPFESGLVPRIQAMSSSLTICGTLPEPGHTSGHHHDVDPHTWLDPRQALSMAETMCAEMVKLKPEAQTEFQNRLNVLRGLLGNLDSEIRDTLAPYQGREIFVFHPAFGHFAAAFGLVQVAVEDHGHEPGPRQLAEVIDRAKASGARAIIVQPQFSRKSAGTVARSAGLEIVTLDPLSPEYDTNLRHIAATLADLFSQAGEK